MTKNLEKRDGTHTVIGATGSYGYAMARLLIKERCNVKIASRDNLKAELLFGNFVNFEKINVMSKESVRNIVNGSDYVYAAFNFPYKNWSSYKIAMGNIISAARSSHSIIIFPGNVYGYGEFNQNPFNENHPLSSKTKKGTIRNEIEGMLQEYFLKGDIGLLIPRFADFYGPNVTNELFGAMFTNPIKNKSAKWILNADLPHSFTFIEDAARATNTMLDNNDLGQVYHISSPAISARQFIEKIYSHLGMESKLKIYTEKQLRFASIINSQIREVLELEYEFREPYIMDTSKFIYNYPNFKFTDYDEGIKTTLEWFRSYGSGINHNK